MYRAAPFVARRPALSSVGLEEGEKTGKWQELLFLELVPRVSCVFAIFFLGRPGPGLKPAPRRLCEAVESVNP